MTGDSSNVPVRIYDDTLSPAAKEIGGALAGAVKLALSPAMFVVRTLNEAMAIAEEKVNERLHAWGADPERVQPPPPEIAAPAIQTLRFEGYDPTLRDLFLNLLARSMLRDAEVSVHPGYAEVLRQLSPTEAQALQVLGALGRAIPLIEVRVIASPSGWHTLLKHINPLGPMLKPATIIPPEAIDNYVRLGLLAIQPLHHITNDDAYGRLERSPEAVAAVEAITAQGATPSFHRYMAEITEFGMHFLKAVGPTDREVEGGAESA